MTTLFLFIVVLSILVFAHELGHFVVAKRAGMKVEEFGFGFPPRLCGIRRGETIYSINWIPIGGFVKIKGECGELACDSDSFASKSAWKRFLVLVAGVVMNIVLAAGLFSVGYMVGLPTVIDDSIPSSARVFDQSIVIMQVVDDSPADRAGIIKGDSLVSIDGLLFTTDTEALDYFSTHTQNGVNVVVSGMDGVNRTYSLTSEYLESAATTGIGIGFITSGMVSFPFFQAIWEGCSATIQITYQIILAFVDLIRQFIATQNVGVDLSGPVGIAVMTGEVARMGFSYLIQFIAILSINLAVINILPFPALDGGRILFLIFERLRGKAVNHKFELAAHNIGFVFLMALVVLVTYRDLINFSDEIWNAVTSIQI